jgi:hypothetical protein
MKPNTIPRPRNACIAGLFIVILPLSAIFAQQLPYGLGNWQEDIFGNCRVVVQVSKPADAIAVHIPWRRRDYNPDKKNIIIVDAATSKRIENVYRVEINREFGDLIFQPITAPGSYYVYYMPHVLTGTSYPKVIYPEPQSTSQTTWLKRHSLTNPLPKDKWLSLPKALPIEIQSIDEFNSFYPMEVIATSDELKDLLAKSPDSSYLLFPEDRKYPIRMTADLPLRWIQSPPRQSFTAGAMPGEFYTFQIGLYAARTAIQDIDIKFSNMLGPAAAQIPASAMRCFNKGGTNWDGRKFEKTCAVEKGKIQPLWCGIEISPDTPPGKYQGHVTVTPTGLKPGKIEIVLNIKGEILHDSGDSQPWRHSRLRWLDSTIAADDEIVAPFTPLRLEGNTISCLGRSVTIDNRGFPKSIKSSFSPEVTHLLPQSREVLSAPVRLIIQDADANTMKWDSKPIQIVKKTPGVIAWTVQSKAGDLTVNCRGRMEFDGFLEFKVTLTASQTTKLNDIRLQIPIAKDAATYMMGMGVKGGYRPAEHHWKWDPAKNHDAAWIGSVNAGLQFSLRDENYARPLNTNFYLLKPLQMPHSWYNDGKGGCDFIETGDAALLINAYSGPRTINPDRPLHYNFNLLLTPFKTLDTKGQWHTRFYHHYESIEKISKLGANTINNHHANEINPYINYPFLRVNQMKEYVARAHAHDLKVKIYYTVRELSNHAHELFALRSLGDEIFLYGSGGGFSWLQEHLTDDYIAAWFVPRYKDAAIINSGVSRWHNYYLEGLNWLVKNVGIDGVYIDDVAFDRTIMKRLRKILDRGKDATLIDLHSANQYNVRDGFVNSANLYLEHFPYINRLWFGEYFQYDLAPDYWLVEVSGIPFGLMGEMLQDGGNPWRGMVYGMTARMPRRKMPQRLWKLWDDFGIEDAQMFGYWSENCPVKTSRKDIPATAYVKKDKVLISIASWANAKVNCKLDIDFQALNINPHNAQLSAPFIAGFQPQATFKPTDQIPVEPAKGWLLILR